MRAVRYGVCNPDEDGDADGDGEVLGKFGLLFASLTGGVETAFCVVERGF